METVETPTIEKSAVNVATVSLRHTQTHTSAENPELDLIYRVLDDSNGKMGSLCQGIFEWCQGIPTKDERRPSMEQALQTIVNYFSLCLACLGHKRTTFPQWKNLDEDARGDTQVLAIGEELWNDVLAGESPASFVRSTHGMDLTGKRKLNAVRKALRPK